MMQVRRGFNNYKAKANRKSEIWLRLNTKGILFWLNVVHEEAGSVDRQNSDGEGQQCRGGYESAELYYDEGGIVAEVETDKILRESD